MVADTLFEPKTQTHIYVVIPKDRPIKEKLSERFKAENEIIKDNHSASEVWLDETEYGSHKDYLKMFNQLDKLC